MVLIVVLDLDVSKLGWFLAALVLFGGGLMLSVALLVNRSEASIMLRELSSTK